MKRLSFSHRLLCPSSSKNTVRSPSPPLQPENLLMKILSNAYFKLRVLDLVSLIMLLFVRLNQGLDYLVGGSGRQKFFVEFSAWLKTRLDLASLAWFVQMIILVDIFRCILIVSWYAWSCRAGQQSMAGLSSWQKLSYVTCFEYSRFTS